MGLCDPRNDNRLAQHKSSVMKSNFLKDQNCKVTGSKHRVKRLGDRLLRNSAEFKRSARRNNFHPFILFLA